MIKAAGIILVKNQQLHLGTTVARLLYWI